MSLAMGLSMYKAQSLGWSNPVWNLFATIMSLYCGVSNAFSMVS